MSTTALTGTYGFRFSDDPDLALGSLFAVGHETARHPGYLWDGLVREDGPLLLLQHTVSGEGRFERGGQISRIGPGRAFLAEIPGRHRYYYSEHGTEPWEFYFILMRPQLILPHWRRFTGLAGDTPLLPPSGAAASLLRLIFAEAAAGRIVDPLLASSYVYQFATELARSGAARPGRSAWPEPVRRAAEYLENRRCEPVSMDLLSDYAGLSKSHFIRRFSACTGLTPAAYLNRLRTERAMELLRGTSLSVERIADELGYSSGSYFIKAFRSQTGITPGAFRGGGESLQYRRLFWD
ncbi:AraC family transcriptional regulator [Paenibacillus spiritus]|uniref:AraC family transcriptional regulator n=1 Tax=Paenibacillus spiritus TaxID=2496557 RepID=A0A5J5FXX8_9BACL|nr:AraC family transcriptional regulator [Paenibacillus spiritus]KAA8998799.1 AraC family transcriptional regulator [Paenibacillus spiritus]